MATTGNNVGKNSARNALLRDSFFIDYSKKTGNPKLSGEGELVYELLKEKKYRLFYHGLCNMPADELFKIATSCMKKIELGKCKTDEELERAEIKMAFALLAIEDMQLVQEKTYEDDYLMDEATH